MEEKFINKMKDLDDRFLWDEKWNNSLKKMKSKIIQFLRLIYDYLGLFKFCIDKISLLILGFASRFAFHNTFWGHH